MFSCRADDTICQLLLKRCSSIPIKKSSSFSLLHLRLLFLFLPTVIHGIVIRLLLSCSHSLSLSRARILSFSRFPSLICDPCHRCSRRFYIFRYCAIMLVPSVHLRCLLLFVILIQTVSLKQIALSNDVSPWDLENIL